MIQYLQRIKNTTFIITLLVVWALFIPVAYFTPRQHLFEIMNAVLAGPLVALALVYAKPTWDAIKLPTHDITASDIWIITRCFGATILSSIFILQWIWRAFDRPSWAIDSVGVAFTRWALASIALLALAAAFTANNRVVVPAYRGVAIFAAISAGVAILLIAIGLG